jgi:hypothetical protein
MLFLHGHQYDVFVQRARWFSELAVWLGGWIRRAYLMSVYRWLTAIDQRRDGITIESSRCPFQRWAVHLALTEGADVVVTGHTHVAARAEYDHLVFVNSGACASGRYMFASLEPKTGTYMVHCDW